MSECILDMSESILDTVGMSESIFDTVDTGMGLTASALNKPGLFKADAKLTQVHSSSSSSSFDTGIGLFGR